MHLRPRISAPVAVLAFCALLAASGFGQARPKAPAPNPDLVWTDTVGPLLDKYCLKCHAGVRQRGGLDLRSLDTMLRGGDSGPAIMPGKPAESRLLQYVLPKAPLHMPLDPGRQLAPTEIETLRAWIVMLPAPKTKPAAGAAAITAWAQAYMEQYRQSRPHTPPPPAGIAPQAAVDFLLLADWKRDGVTPAARCDDATFVRRSYLDLVGRIPSRDESRVALAEPAAGRRERLVDRLLASPEYARHMREVFDPLLMGRLDLRGERRKGRRGGAPPDGSAWRGYLEESFKANRPWNLMVRDMLVARPSKDGPRGAEWFLEARNNNYQSMAEAVAPVVFGVQISCAQCHNHPLVWEIEQRHYWGLVAAFNRSKNVDTDAGPGVAESAIGGFVKFANLKKESQPADLVFLNGKQILEKAPPPDAKEVDSPDLYLVPPVPEGRRAHAPAVPKFSRREAFADVTTRENPMLARAFVNRIWALLMGRGIVQPVDQIDSRHLPSHPDLLEWLARDFEQSGYDVRRLVRTLVLTRAYQLDSRPSGAKPPRPESFARALDKPLTAEQLMHSLLVATGILDRSGADVEIQRTFAAKFPDVMQDNYNPTLQQALFLTNSTTLDGLLKPAPGTTAARLTTLPNGDARVREAFLTVLGRGPDAVEMRQCRAMLDGEPAPAGIKNLLWALLTCAEFQVNH